MTPAESLARYWQRGSGRPVYVARLAGDVVCWSVNRRDVAGRAPLGAAIVRERKPSLPESVRQLARDRVYRPPVRPAPIVEASE